MRRALLFAPYFLPRRRVGSMRPFRFAIHLRSFGWQPTVLTIATPGQQLTDKEAALLHGIEVIGIDTPFDRTVKAESQLGLAKAQAASATRSRATARWQDQMVEAFDRQFPVDTWLPLFLLRYPQLARAVRRVRPEVLWSTGDPWSGLVMGAVLSRHFGLPWIADFRDPWTLCDVRTDRQWGVTKAVDRVLERFVLRTADTVLFQAGQTESNYRRHYADLDLRTTTIYNSYDPHVFEDPVQTQAQAKSGDERLHLGFFGRFRAMSPASVIIDALAAVRARHGDLADRICVHAFGPLNEADAQYAAARGLRHQFVQDDAVPLERALSALRRFDVLLLSTDPRRDEIIPAKLLEYLPAGRPILSLSRNPEVGRILAQTQTGVQLPLDDQAAIADLLAGCVQAKQSGQPLPIPFSPVPHAIQRFEAHATTGALADLLADAAARKSP